MIDLIDISVYQGDVPLPTWSALYAAGQRVACIGSAHPRPNSYAEANLGRAQTAGMALATYIVVWPGVPSANTVQVAKQCCGRFWPKLTFAAIDCEEDGITEAQIFGMETALKAEGQRPIIYTGGWWWGTDDYAGHFNNSHAFKHLPLWAANYSVPPGGAVPLYGGWTQESLVGHQYAGTVEIPGVNYPSPGNPAEMIGLSVDRNVFRKDFIYPAPPQEEENTDMQMPIWAYAKDKPASAPFRTYLLYAERGVGLFKDYVKTPNDHYALEGAGMTLIPMDVAHLKLWQGGPEPDAP